MEAESRAAPVAARVTREQLALVVRRAAELAASELDAQDRLSEEEVVRIAAELGLPAHHVRRALYELPQGEAASFLDRITGLPVNTATRTVPGEAHVVLERLEEHFTTEEYLRTLRRREGYALFGPAEDTLSRIARSVRGSSSRELCRAKELGVSVRALGGGQSHVRIDADVSNRRGGAVAAGFWAGVAAFLGSATVVAAATVPFLPPGLVEPAIATAFGGGAVVGAWGGVKVARARLSRFLQAVGTETEGLLDRLERGEPLRAPPAPWRKRLQRTVGGRKPRA